MRVNSINQGIPRSHCCISPGASNAYCRIYKMETGIPGMSTNAKVTLHVSRKRRAQYHYSCPRWMKYGVKNRVGIGWRRFSPCRQMILEVTEIKWTWKVNKLKFILDDIWASAPVYRLRNVTFKQTSWRVERWKNLKSVTRYNYSWYHLHFIDDQST